MTTTGIDRILLGDNPFTGVNHMSQEYARARNEKLNSEKIFKVIDVALNSGAEGLVFTTHPVMFSALQNMKHNGYQRQFGLYPILPDVQSLVYIATERGLLGLLTDMLGNLSLMDKARTLVGGGRGVLTIDPTRMMQAYINAEINKFLRICPNGSELRTVFLHEIVTEVIMSFKLTSVLENYINFVSQSLGVKPGFVTRNFVRFTHFVSQIGIPLQSIVVMSPFNKVGFQMNPSREACEQALLEFPELNVIAMSILAAGYLQVDEAVEYIRRLPRNVSCVVGVSSERHAVDTFTYLRNSLDTKNK